MRRCQSPPWFLFCPRCTVPFNRDRLNLSQHKEPTSCLQEQGALCLHPTAPGWDTAWCSLHGAAAQFGVKHVTLGEVTPGLTGGDL